MKPQKLYWRWEGSDRVHGPVSSVGVAARCAWDPACQRGMIVGTAHVTAWHTDIFGQVDEMFDNANQTSPSRDYPPSCAWRPEHLAILRVRLGETLDTWLAEYGHARHPGTNDIAWHVVFTAEEVARMARGEMRREGIIIDAALRTAR